MRGRVRNVAATNRAEFQCADQTGRLDMDVLDIATIVSVVIAAALFLSSLLMRGL